MDREDALKKQFVREARIGVTLIGVTLAVFVFVAYGKMSGRFSRSPDLGPASQEITASTLNPQSQRERTANASFAAIQAATRSVIDQVDPQIGDTSPTESPPMPVPKIFTSDPLPTSEPPSFHSDTSSDSSTQNSVNAPDTAHPSTKPAWVHSIAAPTIQSTQFSREVPEAQELDPRLAGDKIATSIPPFVRQSPVLPVHTSNSSSVLNPPVPAVRSSFIEDPSDRGSEVDSKDDGVVNSTRQWERERIVLLASGESLWTISQRQYGDGRLFRALAAHNRLEHSTAAQLDVGTEIRLPSTEKLQAEFPTLFPADLARTVPSDAAADEDIVATRTYVTGRDETLFAIARDQLGQASRYVEIIELNSRLLPGEVTSSTNLPSGIRLRLSEK